MSRPMQFQIRSQRGATTACEPWTDSDGARLEAHLAHIAVAIVVQGERQHRDGAHSYREWVIKKKAELAEGRSRRAKERQRLERERLARVERAQVDRLLAQARALREAERIPLYVEAVCAAQTTLEHRLQAVELERWTAWALGQAKRIDPVRNGQFRTIQVDDVESV